MKARPVVPRERARADVEAALDHYLERAEYIDIWRVLHVRRDIPERIED